MRTGTKPAINGYSKAEIINLAAKIHIARIDFWSFCKLMHPDFYKESRIYLKNFCEELQRFFEGNARIMVVNMPPQHGKTRTVKLFCEWVFGKDRQQKIMVGSYNEHYAKEFSKQVREAIKVKKSTMFPIVYRDIFPEVKVKKGYGEVLRWTIDGGYSSFLATSPGGSATGSPSTLTIIDDMVKSAYEAYNDNILESHWDWFRNTMMQRGNMGFKVIIVMTRWANGDLAGKVLENYGDVVHVCYKIENVDSDGVCHMLCDEVMDKDLYEFKTKEISPEIKSANFNQIPIEIGGRLYTRFECYEHPPKIFDIIKNYTDTADEGKDWLCSINYGVIGKKAYILDVVYTQEPMEVTEKLVANMLSKDKVKIADIESNNGGRGFARNVDRILKELRGGTQIKPFTQSLNKVARILSNSTNVMNNIYFPKEWALRFPKFYKDVTAFKAKVTNAHDDAADVLTGIAEKMAKGTIEFF